MITLDKEFYSPMEVANILKVHRQTVYQWIQKGYLETWKSPGVRGSLRIASGSLREFLNKGKTL